MAILTDEVTLYEIDPSKYPTCRYRNHMRYRENDSTELPESYDSPTFENKTDDVYYRVESGHANKLDLVASSDDHYSNEELWWVIAEANDIIDPLDVPVGTVLKVPSIKTIYGRRGVLA